jgi:hypothetical protein
VEFRVIWEIEIDAESPKEAAEQARALQMNPDLPATVFDVWDHTRQRTYRVDVAPATNRLDKAEVADVRAIMRRLQCSPGLQPHLKNILMVMLVFLDTGQLRERTRPRL